MSRLWGLQLAALDVQLWLTALFSHTHMAAITRSLLTVCPLAARRGPVTPVQHWVIVSVLKGKGDYRIATRMFQRRTVVGSP